MSPPSLTGHSGELRVLCVAATLALRSPNKIALPNPFLRRWLRAAWIRRGEGARRSDVTLRGEPLDDYAPLRSFSKALHCVMARKTRPGSIRLSDTEVITTLHRAAADIRDHHEQARTERFHRMLRRYFTF